MSGAGISDLVRSSVLTGYGDLVAGLNGDTGALLRRYKVDPRALERRDSLISFRAVVKLLEGTAQSLGCLDFGLRMSQQQDLAILGPVAIIGLNSPTVGDALRAMIDHLNFYSPSVLTTIEPRDAGHVLLTYDLALDGEPHKRQLFELALGLYYRDMQILTQGHFVPVAVWFRHTPLLPQRIYRRYFGSAVRFGQPINAIVARQSDLRRRIDNADPQLCALVADYVRSSTASHPLDMARQVAFLVRKMLAHAECSLPAVARHLYLHERTLQRRLTKSGASFEAIVDNVRRERAEELLSESRLSMAEVAARLGYHEQSSFNRACRRWFGRAPNEFKHQQLARAES
jgi:AraC-like DNA-binding protein